MAETKLIKSLRSVRQFSDREIPDDVLRDILDTACGAGSAKNSQPWDLVVVTNRYTLVALSKCGQFAWHLAGAKLALALVMRGRCLERHGRGTAHAKPDAGRLGPRRRLLHRLDLPGASATRPRVAGYPGEPLSADGALDRVSGEPGSVAPAAQRRNPAGAPAAGRPC